jgi:hypothetical protein
MSTFIAWLLDARLHIMLAVSVSASVVGSGRWSGPAPLDLPVIDSRFTDDAIVIYPDGSTSRQFARLLPAVEGLEAGALAAE